MNLRDRVERASGPRQSPEQAALTVGLAMGLVMAFVFESVWFGLFLGLVSGLGVLAELRRRQQGQGRPGRRAEP